MADGILAVGTEAQPITFTSAAAFPPPNSWSGITLLAGTREIRFEHCVIRGNTTGIYLEYSSCEDPACEAERVCTSRPMPWLFLLMEDEDPPAGNP